ncbi:MAG: hypothetical protein KDB88_14210, partial [Flavobacteriales bacterium]|nr:hypothetical protein [Flavobacteriales bacterium]
AGIHLLSGAGYMNDSSTTKNVLLMKVGPGGADWMKFYDLGSVSPQLEDGLRVIALNDGNFLVVGGYTSTGSLDAFAMKVDAQGDVLWARRYMSDAATLIFGGALELADGSLLITGTGADYSGILVLLQSDGTQQWVQRYEAGGNPAGYGLSRPRAAYPDGYWVQTRDRQLYLNDQLMGCDFTDLPMYSSSAFVPTVVEPVFTNASYAPDLFDLTHSGRVHEPAWTPICVDNGIVEEAGSTALTAFPVPTEDQLFLSGPDVRIGMSVIIRDGLGREIWRGVYSGGLDVAGLTAGSYVVELSELGGRLPFVKH